MRVKKLEVFGFKSFANKTTIHFEPGVTAIVGPNGSGKSNLVDGIRWVLGEHNPRDVRAPRLEDVIFNGTDHKAPLSMAEVNLTIANEQGLLPIAFTEVTITRRVYRSGESECFINQSPCRLKDIQELFLGTGLGGGTYAIIEQGHIDMILSSKPEERRVVFEEASGVAKYLAKKHEATRRLDEVEENLVRIADIVNEVRRQVSALERAANKARQYQSQWDELKSLELRLAVDELRGGQSRHQELETRIRALAAQREQLQQQKTGEVALVESCNAAVSAVQQQLQQLRTQLVECASRIEQHEGQIGLKSQWIEELAQQATQLETEEGQIRAHLGRIEEQWARTGGGQTELQSQLGALEEQLRQHADELSVLALTIQSAIRSVHEAKAQLFEAASEATHQRNQVAEATSRLQSLEAQAARLTEQQAHRHRLAEELGGHRKTAAQERLGVQAQHDDIRQRLTTAQQSLDAAGVRRHELGGRVHQLRDQVATERARVKLLEDLWHRHEGFPETVKWLMSQSVDGLIGPLVDVVQAAPGYEELVESALGPLAEALVVRDRQALERCRQLLSAQQLESCRFLVLSDCPADAAPEPVHGAAWAGVAGAVTQYVRADAAYQPLVSWLLNDSWIIDDIQRLLRSGAPPQHRFISLRGDRWDRRSWRFGGTRSDASPRRLGRKQRWEQSQESLRAIEEEFRRLEADAQQAERQWQTVLGEQESAKAQLSHLVPALHKLDSQLAQMVRELARADEERQAYELELQELATQQDELRASLAAAQQAVAQAEARQQQLERSLTETQSARESAEQARQQRAIAHAQVEATRQSVLERLSALQHRTQELTADRDQLQRQAEAKVGQRQDAAARSQRLSQELQTHRQEAQRLQEARARVEVEAGAISQSLRDEEARRDQVLPRLLAVEQQLSALSRQVQQHEQQLSERQFRRAHVLERLRELYQLDETTIEAEQQAAASSEPLTDEQRTTMTERVQKLRGKLEGMGPVSLGSVEEYDELKRRLEFLQTQQQDLVQARDDLKASITQINRTARAQFRETFARITQEFQHYYTRLFDGGEANLILLDEEDVLECGIDIVARPPGKRLQTISLLSGGERALTAVALLFALFKVRPSPFCILDEIDAPLDEANVDRFTRVLEEFLALSQFILVTHNKKTITKADSLYGVTMEEPGVSKILSAKLTTAEPAPVAA